MNTLERAEKAVWDATTKDPESLRAASIALGELIDWLEEAGSDHEVLTCHLAADMWRLRGFSLQATVNHAQLNNVRKNIVSRLKWCSRLSVSRSS